MPGTGWAHSVSFHPLELCKEGRRTISILPTRKQWLEDVGNTFELSFICLTPKSLLLSYSKLFLSFPNIMGPKGESYIVWFRGYWKDCPSALKIPLLQEGFSGRAQTLETWRKYTAKSDHTELENFYMVKKKGEITNLENICNPYKGQRNAFLTDKTQRSTVQ